MAGACLFAVPSDALIQDDGSVSDIFKEHVNSIVMIKADNGDKGLLGSGFIITADGLIATNYHLVKNADRIYVKLHDGRVFDKAVVQDFDTRRDLALVKITARNLKPVVLGDPNKVTIGQRVVTIGNPMGLESTVSDGLVSAVRTLENKVKVLQISVPLSQGSSGGPLFNLDGEVVGITTMAFVGGQDLNFAVPVSYLKTMLIGTDYYARKGRSYQKNFDPRYEPQKRSQDGAAGKPRYILYSIKPRDTLFGISRRFNTSVEEIQAVNKLNNSKIFVGYRIKVPQKQKAE